jgi:hypothetical protein
LLISRSSAARDARLARRAATFLLDRLVAGFSMEDMAGAIDDFIGAEVDWGQVLYRRSDHVI